MVDDSFVSFWQGFITPRLSGDYRVAEASALKNLSWGPTVDPKKKQKKKQGEDSSGPEAEAPITSTETTSVVAPQGKLHLVLYFFSSNFC